jgi:oligoendopeptidase F
MKPARSLVLLLLAALCLSAPARAEERANVADQYKWNLTDMYPSVEAWQAARDSLAARIPEISKFQGRLGESADVLYQGLSTAMDIARGLERLSVYASMVSDEDLRDQKHLEMNQGAQKLQVDFGSAISFARPEILALGADQVKAFVASDARLKPYAIYLDDIVRWAPHTLSAAEEKVAAQAGDLGGAGYSVRSVFANAEMPFPSVTLSGGESVKLDAPGYSKYRQSGNRDDRIKVFQTYFSAYKDFIGSYGSMLNAQTKAHVFDKDVHKFDSCLDAALFPNNVPTSVYSQLIADVHANLPTLHRYLKLRQRMMGLDTLRYEDLYAPLVKSVEMHFTPEQAQDVVLKALAPLGPDYVTTLAKGFADRWVDWMPTTGKRSGAYSTGAYEVHPYQLQNFTGLYDEVSTVAHESGHSMHTYLAYKAQPFVTANYATFVAEVASTCNEALLLDYMLKQHKDKDTQLYLLGNRLENLRTTLFRQTMFAEFELRMHEMLEKGQPLTGENLTALYLGLVKDYYGDAQGVCKVDDLYGVEWSLVPHFYYDFYVFQYATSIVASSTIASNILAEAKGKKHAARDAYLNMLASGSSKYPIDLLKGAGVDMTTPAPFTAAMAEMNRVMDQMEKLLAQK